MRLVAALISLLVAFTAQASPFDDVEALAEDAGSAAVLVVKAGDTIIEWGATAEPLSAHSIRKPLLGALIGIAIGEGKIDPESTLADLAIDDLQPLTEQEKQARVIDLLRGRSGVYHPAAYETAGKKRERPARGAYAPGTHFWSNNWDFNSLLTIYEQQTGERFFEAFDARIARPIGMQDYRPEHGQYHREPGVSMHPAYPLRISARDLARVGQLMLQGGQWAGTRILPDDWVTRSTTPSTVFGPGGGYTGGFNAGAGFGMLWWIYPAGCHPQGRPAIDRHDAYAAQGAGGHMLLVVPDLELVIVHRAPTDRGRTVDWNALWAIMDRIVAAVEAPPAQ